MKKLLVLIPLAFVLTACEAGNSIQHGDRTKDIQKEVQKISDQLDRIERGQ
jgi:hypothetical protein